MDVLLVGYGAVGIIYAYALENSKRVRVTAIARGNFQGVHEKGADIESEQFGTHVGWKPYRTLPSVAAATDRHYAYVVLAAKALPDVLPTPVLLAPLLTEFYLDSYGMPTFVLLQNGLGIEEDLYRAAIQLFKDPIIITAAVYIETNLTPDRAGVKHVRDERLRVGIYTGKESLSETTPVAATSLQTFIDIVAAGGGNIASPDNIQHEKFSKNCWNAVVGACCALARYPTPAFARVEPITRPFLRATLLEMMALAHALKYPMSEANVDALVEDTVGPNGSWKTDLKGSMLVDVEKGSPIEVEVIVGTLVRWGKEKHVPMPRLQTIYALLSVYQAQAVANSSLV